MAWTSRTPSVFGAPEMAAEAELMMLLLGRATATVVHQVVVTEVGTAALPCARTTQGKVADATRGRTIADRYRVMDQWGAMDTEVATGM